MGQVTIYLDNEVEALMAAEVQAQNISKSKWLANLIREKLANEWPKDIIDSVGTWNEFPDSSELRKSLGADSPRECF